MRNPFTESAVRCTSAQEFDNAPVDAYLKDDTESVLHDMLHWDYGPDQPAGPLERQAEPSASSKGEAPDLSRMAQPVTPETGAPESPETHESILGKFLNTSDKILQEAPHGTPPVPADDPHRHDEQDAEDFRHHRLGKMMIGTPVENQPRVPPPR